MKRDVRKIIQNARLAGVNIGLPGQRRAGRAAPVTRSFTQTLASGAAYALPERKVTRDYVVPHPFEEPQVITPESVGFVQNRGYYQANTECALNDLATSGYGPRNLRSGRTLVLVHEITETGNVVPLFARMHLHHGGTSPDDMKFMQTLAAFECKRLRLEYEKVNSSACLRNVIVVVPPHDRVTGKVPWLQQDSTVGTTFDRLLEPHGPHPGLGYADSIRTIEKARQFATKWEDLVDQPALTSSSTHKADLMEAIRRSSGSLHNPS